MNDPEWYKIFEQLFLQEEGRRIGKSDDLLIFVLQDGLLAPRRALSNGGVLAGLPESTEWRDSLCLNLALQAEFTLK